MSWLLIAQKQKMQPTKSNGRSKNPLPRSCSKSRIGEQFDSIVTGASEKGTWVRLLNVPVEGKLVEGFEGLDVGERVRVQLIDTNVERGFIDFRKVGSSGHE